jgi:hypothetical protein
MKQSKMMIYLIMLILALHSTAHASIGGVLEPTSGGASTRMNASQANSFCSLLINKQNDLDAELFLAEALPPIPDVATLPLMIPLLGMIITIVVIIRTSKVSLLTISEKTRETMLAFEKSIAAQRDIAERNLRAQVRSKNRQDWINELRTQIAEFIALLPIKHVRLRMVVSKENDFRAAQENFKMTGGANGEVWLRRANEEYCQARQQDDDCHLQLARTLAKVDLLLNPNEQPCADLIRLMKNVFSRLSNMESVAQNTTEDDMVAITQRTQTILKSEWEKVKLME